MKRNFGIGASPAKDYKKGYPQPGSSAVTREGVVDPDVAVARPTERTHAGIIQKKGSPAKHSLDMTKKEHDLHHAGESVAESIKMGQKVKTISKKTIN